MTLPKAMRLSNIALRNYVQRVASIHSVNLKSVHSYEFITAPFVF
jgi:hypothetical protein